MNLTVKDEFNCSSSVSSIINILSDVLIYAPNAFTPDGDNLNQKWRVYIDGIDIYDFHLTIYNRWGEIIWESYDSSAEWDGSYGNSIAEEGVYIWVIQAKDAISDKKYEFKGHLTIIK